MVRALEKYFGATPDLDIEEQRAILVLKKPMVIDWKVVEDLIKRANYTFGGLHLRARGRLIESEGEFSFELAGSGQRVKLSAGSQDRKPSAREMEISARLEHWKTSATFAILEAK